MYSKNSDPGDFPTPQGSDYDTGCSGDEDWGDGPSPY